METNKEVKNIADHKEQHHAEAPPPQVSWKADNPLRPPQSQQQPASGAMEGDGGENKEIPETEEETYCCWGPCCFRRVVSEDYGECCCTDLCVLMCLCMTLVFFCCRNGCRDSLYP